MDHSIGKSATKLLPSSERKGRCVCYACNSNWMSQLEDLNKTVLGSLMHDLSIPLDIAQQAGIAAWATKTAMTFQSVRSNDMFYSRAEREQLRANLTIPLRTVIWLGRYIPSTIAAQGNDLWHDFEGVPRSVKGHVTTIVIGHLAIQILSVHVREEHNSMNVFVDSKHGPWDKFLLSIWPADRVVMWPPARSFSERDSIFNFDTLVGRWKVGPPAV